MVQDLCASAALATLPGGEGVSHLVITPARSRTVTDAAIGESALVAGENDGWIRPIVTATGDFGPKLQDLPATFRITCGTAAPHPAVSTVPAPPGPPRPGSRPLCRKRPIRPATQGAPFSAPTGRAHRAGGPPCGTRTVR